IPSAHILNNHHISLRSPPQPNSKIPLVIRSPLQQNRKLLLHRRPINVRSKHHAVAHHHLNVMLISHRISLRPKANPAASQSRDKHPHNHKPYSIHRHSKPPPPEITARKYHIPPTPLVLGHSPISVISNDAGLFQELFSLR